MEFAASTVVEKARSNKANEQIEVLKTNIEKYTALRICTQTLKDMKNGARIVPKISNLRSKQARQTRLTFEK